MKTNTTNEGVVFLTPDEGKMLKNGDSYSDLVFLARNASPEDWTEIDASEVPEDESFIEASAAENE